MVDLEIGGRYTLGDCDLRYMGIGWSHGDVRDWYQFAEWGKEGDKVYSECLKSDLYLLEKVE